MAFQISFAGQDFVLDDPVVNEWVNRHIPLEDLRETLPVRSPWPSKNLAGVAYPLWPDPPRFRIGTYFYPAGASRWSEFHGLASTSAVNKMKAACFPSGATAAAGKFQFVCDPSAYDSGDTLATGGISTNLYMLPPRPLAAFGGSYDDLWLVTLVDERYLWQFKAGGKQILSSASTWDGFITSLEAYLGITVNGNPVSSTYGIPSEDSALYSLYENPAVLLDAVAANVGCVIARKFDGTYSLVSPTSSNTSVTSNRPATLRVGGGDLEAVDAGFSTALALNAVLPASVTVTFPKRVINGPWIDTRDVLDLVRPSYGDVYTKTITLSAAGFSQYSGYNGSKVFRDTARALYNTEFDASPANQTALDALALQIAQDYYNSFLSGIDEVYPGIRAWAPEGADDILWVYNSSESSYTRVQRKPWNFGVEEFQHEFTATTAGHGEVPFFAKITSGTQPYAWTEVTPATGGTWATRSGGRSGTTGTNPAYEFNGNASVAANSIAVMWRGYDNNGGTKQEYVFVCVTVSGQSGTFKVCDSGGTVTKTLTFTNGLLTGVA